MGLSITESIKVVSFNFIFIGILTFLVFCELRKAIRNLMLVFEIKVQDFLFPDQVDVLLVGEADDAFVGLPFLLEVSFLLLFEHLLIVCLVWVETGIGHFVG